MITTTVASESQISYVQSASAPTLWNADLENANFYDRVLDLRHAADFDFDYEEGCDDCNFIKCCCESASAPLHEDAAFEGELVGWDA
jgi:hypothetical protein